MPSNKYLDTVVKEGCMVKRSQNKKPYTKVNFKQRWFVLSNTSLIYYDTDNKEVCIVQLSSYDINNNNNNNI